MISIVVKTIRNFVLFQILFCLCRRPLPHFKENCYRTSRLWCRRSKSRVLSSDGVRPQEWKSTDRRLRLYCQTLPLSWQLRRWPLLKKCYWCNCKHKKIPCLEYLTIIPRARMGYESIAHEAAGYEAMRGYEGERNNCFSKIQPVGQKNIETKHLSQVKARH